LPLAPWRLEEGSKSASDEALRTGIRRAGHGEFWSAMLVAAGVGLEVLIAIKNPAYGSLWERIGPVVSDVLIFLGVVGEYLFASRASAFQGELTRRSNDRLAIAEKEAADAQEELRRFRAPRRLDQTQKAELAEAMKPFAGRMYDASVSANEPEMLGLLMSLDPALALAGWVPTDWTSPVALVVPRMTTGKQTAVGMPVENVLVTCHPISKGTLGPICEAFAEALNGFGIKAVGNPVIFGAGMSGNAGAIHIMVGRKT
jgi:hypothetical protein